MQCNGINDHDLGQERRFHTINDKRVKRDIIVIGASAGGVQALQRIFTAFPSDMEAVVGVVLHRGPRPSELMSVLARRSTLTVVEPHHRMILKPGTIYLAPAGHRLLFQKRAAVVQRGPREHSTRPSIDPLFRSAAESYGPRVVGLLLTGCGEDGVSGLVSITKGLGLTLVQDPDEAYMPYMPLNAMRYDDVAGVVSLSNAASILALLAGGDRVRVEGMAAGR
jgi:two-component system chemotaxis response regulator CheB